MNIFDIRKENYRRLQAEFRLLPQEQRYPEHGALGRFGKFTGVAARYLTHINSGIKRLGDASCQKMEVAFKKPPGWMDEDHGNIVESRSTSGVAKQNPATLIPPQFGLMTEEEFLSRLRSRLDGASPIEVSRILDYFIALEERKKAEADVRNKEGAK